MIAAVAPRKKGFLLQLIRPAELETARGTGENVYDQCVLWHTPGEAEEALENIARAKLNCGGNRILLVRRVEEGDHLVSTYKTDPAYRLYFSTLNQSMEQRWGRIEHSREVKEWHRYPDGHSGEAHKIRVWHEDSCSEKGVSCLLRPSGQRSPAGEPLYDFYLPMDGEMTLQGRSIGQELALQVAGDDARYRHFSEALLETYGLSQPLSDHN